MLEAGEKVQAHPAVSEYLRWRQGQPMMYRSLGDMPLQIAKGFLYLLNNGSLELPTETVMSDVMARREQAMALEIALRTGFTKDGLEARW